MKIKSQKDFFSGLMFLAIGLAFSWGASTYTVGTGARMGPGYFPLMLGILMTVLGAAITFSALVVETEGGDPVGSWAWKPLVLVLGANVVFGVLLGGLPSIKLPSMGLIPAIYAVVIVSSLAAEKFHPKQVLILATALVAVSYVAFIKLLNLNLPLWPTFITG
ncbi:MAG: tripartite tricarboxylate transporter TctB family protein [Burkholderiales bacterium]